MNLLLTDLINDTQIIVPCSVLNINSIKTVFEEML